MPDPNMELAYLLSRIPGWITWAEKANLAEFKSPEQLALFLDKHDKAIAQNLFKIYKALQAIICSIEGRNIGTILRLWSGCIASAKLIALKTGDGPVTADYRRSVVLFDTIRCKRDPIWKMGYRAGPALKKLRKEKVCYDGIPKRASIRRA